MNASASAPPWLAPLACLIAVGALLGLSTNLIKIAANVGLAPLPFLAWSVLGASLILLAVAAFRRALPSLTKRTTEYFLVSALISIAVPNLIFYSAVPHVGVSFVALSLTLPPLFTYLGALLMRMERFCSWRATGIAFALGGASLIAVLKLQAPDAAFFWIGATFLSPIILAAGNLYRSLRWPAGCRPESLAPGMMAASAVALFLMAGLPIKGFSLATPADPTAIIVILAQTLALALQYYLFFILQKLGGPVLLSLLGSVAAIVAVPIAILTLGETPPEGLFGGAALITLGVVFVTYGGIKAAGQESAPGDPAERPA